MRRSPSSPVRLHISSIGSRSSATIKANSAMYLSFAKWLSGQLACRTRSVSNETEVKVAKDQNDSFRRGRASGLRRMRNGTDFIFDSNHIVESMSSCATLNAFFLVFAVPFDRVVLKTNYRTCCIPNFTLVAESNLG